REPFILCIGETENKNIEYAINLFRALWGTEFERLYIVGRHKHQAKEVQRLIHDPWTDGKVFFVEKINLHDMVDLYMRTKLLLFSSLYEGFGLPVIEAMATGTPVAVLDRDIMREVGKNGVFYLTGELPIDRDNILKLFSDKNGLHEMIERGFKRVREFSYERSAEQLMEIYSGIAQ
ncbi:MAG: glycosyltransferase, partial [bacterium]